MGPSYNFPPCLKIASLGNVLSLWFWEAYFPLIAQFGHLHIVIRCSQNIINEEQGFRITIYVMTPGPRPTIVYYDRCLLHLRSYREPICGRSPQISLRKKPLYLRSYRCPKAIIILCDLCIQHLRSHWEPNWGQGYQISMWNKSHMHSPTHKLYNSLFWK